MGWKAIGLFACALTAAACGNASFDVAPEGDGSIDTGSLSDTSAVDSNVTVDSSTSDSTKSDSSTPGDTRPDSLKDVVLCEAAPSFPTFDRGCGTDDNCAFGLHQVDCCGTQTAIGFNHGEKPGFDTAEAAYRAACPVACGCDPGPISAESGVTTTDPSKIKVGCAAGGSCKTYVGP